MGASTAAHRLDYAKLRDEVAPAFRARVIELGVPMFGDCETLRPDLALRDDDSVLLETYSQRTGACRSLACPGRTACPLHSEGQHAMSAETLMTQFQRAFASRCCGPPSWLGRRGQWHDFLRWYSMELGHSDALPSAMLHGCLRSDPLLRSISWLSQRGAAIGWGDGGFGEGLLGWLDPDETRAFVAALGAYSLQPGDPVPAELREADPYDADEYLPELRRVMTKLLSAATIAASDGGGLALIRS